MSERIVTASRLVNAAPEVIFELIADPRRQPEWDGNDNLQVSDSPRITQVSEVFTMRNTSGKVKENHVVVFEEGRRIGWLPADEGTEPPGHLWLWELEPDPSGATKVTHTYNWSALNEEQPSGIERMNRARGMTVQKLDASLARLAAFAEGSAQPA